MRRLIALLVGALPVLASTITNAEIDFGATAVTGTATASYFGDTSLDPGFLLASAHATAITLGPVRNGFIEITGGGGGESGGGGNVSIGGYSFACGSSGCSPAGNFSGADLPFTLGVPFSVDISAAASSLGDGSGHINFQFSVFESIDLGFPFQPFKGASVSVSDPVDTPEPVAILLSGGGLALLALARRIRPRQG